MMDPSQFEDLQEVSLAPMTPSLATPLARPYAIPARLFDGGLDMSGDASAGIGTVTANATPHKSGFMAGADTPISAAPSASGLPAWDMHVDAAPGLQSNHAGQRGLASPIMPTIVTHPAPSGGSSRDSLEALHGAAARSGLSSPRTPVDGHDGRDGGVDGLPLRTAVSALSTSSTSLRSQSGPTCHADAQRMGPRAATPEKPAGGKWWSSMTTRAQQAAERAFQEARATRTAAQEIEALRAINQHLEGEMQRLKEEIDIARQSSSLVTATPASLQNEEAVLAVQVTQAELQTLKADYARLSQSHTVLQAELAKTQAAAAAVQAASTGVVAESNPFSPTAAPATAPLEEAVSQRIASLEQERQAMEAKIAEAEARERELQDQLEHARQTHAAQAAIAEVQSSAMEEASSSYETALAQRLEADQQTWAAQIAELEAQHRVSVEALRNQNAQLEERVAELASRADHEKTQIAKLNATLLHTMQEKAALTEQKEALETASATHRRSLDDLASSQQHQWEERVAELLAQKGAVEAKYELLAHEMARQTSQLHVVQSHNQETDEALASLTSEITLLKSTLKRATDERDNLQTQCAEAGSTIGQLRQKRVEADQTITRLEDQLDVVGTKLASQSSQLETAERHVATLESELSTIRTNLGSKLDEKLAELASTQAQLDETREQLSELRDLHAKSEQQHTTHLRELKRQIMEAESFQTEKDEIILSLKAQAGQAREHRQALLAAQSEISKLQSQLREQQAAALVTAADKEAAFAVERETLLSAHQTELRLLEHKNAELNAFVDSIKRENETYQAKITSPTRSTASGDGTSGSRASWWGVKANGVHTVKELLELRQSKQVLESQLRIAKLEIESLRLVQEMDSPAKSDAEQLTLTGVAALIKHAMNQPAATPTAMEFFLRDALIKQPLTSGESSATSVSPAAAAAAAAASASSTRAVVQLQDALTQSQSECARLTQELLTAQDQYQAAQEAARTQHQASGQRQRAELAQLHDHVAELATQVSKLTVERDHSKQQLLEVQQTLEAKVAASASSEASAIEMVTKTTRDVAVSPVFMMMSAADAETETERETQTPGNPVAEAKAEVKAEAEAKTEAEAEMKAKFVADAAVAAVQLEERTGIIKALQAENAQLQARLEAAQFHAVGVTPAFAVDAATAVTPGSEGLPGIVDREDPAVIVAALRAENENLKDALANVELTLVRVRREARKAMSASASGSHSALPSPTHGDDAQPTLTAAAQAASLRQEVDAAQQQIVDLQHQLRDVLAQRDAAALPTQMKELQDQLEAAQARHADDVASLTAQLERMQRESAVAAASMASRASSADTDRAEATARMAALEATIEEATRRHHAERAALLAAHAEATQVLETQVAQLEQELEARQSEIARLKARVTDLEAQIASASASDDAQLAQMRQQASELHAQLEAECGLRHAAESRAAALTTDLLAREQLVQQLGQQNAEREAAQKHLRAAQLQVGEMETQIASLQATMTSLEAAHEDKNKAEQTLVEDLANAETQLAQLRETLTERERTLAERAADMATLQATLAQHEATAAASSAASAAAASLSPEAVSALQTRVARLKAELVYHDRQNGLLIKDLRKQLQRERRSGTADGGLSDVATASSIMHGRAASANAAIARHATHSGGTSSDGDIQALQARNALLTEELEIKSQMVRHAMLREHLHQLQPEPPRGPHAVQVSTLLSPTAMQKMDPVLLSEVNMRMQRLLEEVTMKVMTLEESMRALGGGAPSNANASGAHGTPSPTHAAASPRLHGMPSLSSATEPSMRGLTRHDRGDSFL